MTDVAFIVPRRPDHGHRDRLWAHARARWERDFPGVPIIEGHHIEGPFNRGAAINQAAAETDAGVLVIIDSDVMLKRSQVLAAIERAQAGVVTWAHRRWREFSETATMRTLADRRLFGPEFEDVDLDLLVERTNPISWSCCQAVPRDVFEDMGGFDRRFRGWGFEDGAWAALVRGRYRWDRIEGDVINLWHPRSPERIVLGESAKTASDDYVRNALLGRRYMVAAIRDHRVGDQLGEDRLSDELAATHVRNLTLDDERFLKLARAKGMPEAGWERWWPTLDELVEGARTGHAGPPPTVTVVVHSGGDEEVWPERRHYLVHSIASLAEQVQGPIVQRVVYAVWPSDRILEEIRRIVEPFGFYVVGPEPGDWRPGHPWSRGQLWRYLGRKAIGDYIFGTEDDFTYDRPVDLVPMMETLAAHPHLRQLALLRAPVFPLELAAGGIIEQHPERYEHVSANGHSRVEHRDHFTNNPSLYRRSLPSTEGLPVTEGSEVAFARQLNRDPKSRFAYWGDGTPWVSHIGEVRGSVTATY